MKPTAYFINVARGPIVDEAALIDALRAAAFAGAALDVFEQEPVAPDNPLLTMDNVIVTPHSLCWTDECFHNMAATGLASIVDALAGRRAGVRRQSRGARPPARAGRGCAHEARGAARALGDALCLRGDAACRGVRPRRAIAARAACAPENTLAAFALRARDRRDDARDRSRGDEGRRARHLARSVPQSRPRARTDGRWLAGEGSADPLADARRTASATTSAGSILTSRYAKQFPAAASRDGQRFPTLAQVFALVQGEQPAVRLNIETKITPTTPVTTRRRGDVRAAHRRGDPRRGARERRDDPVVRLAHARRGEEARAGDRDRLPHDRDRRTTTPYSAGRRRPSPWHAGLDLAAYGGSLPRSSRRPAAARGHRSFATSTPERSRKRTRWASRAALDRERSRRHGAPHRHGRRRAHHRLPGPRAQGDGGQGHAAAVAPELPARLLLASPTTSAPFGGRTRTAPGRASDCARTSLNVEPRHLAERVGAAPSRAAGCRESRGGRAANSSRRASASHRPIRGRRRPAARSSVELALERLVAGEQRRGRGAQRVIELAHDHLVEIAVEDPHAARRRRRSAARRASRSASGTCPAAANVNVPVVRCVCARALSATDLREGRPARSSCREERLELIEPVGVAPGARAATREAAMRAMRSHAGSIQSPRIPCRECWRGSSRRRSSMR